jgi:hypothetical protein
LSAVGPVSFWISGGTSWMLKPPPVTYLDRLDEKFPVNFAWERQSSWEPAFGPNKFLTLTRTLKVNLAVGRIHETYRRRWTVHVLSNSHAPYRRVLVEKLLVTDFYGHSKVIYRNLGMLIQNNGTPMTSSYYRLHILSRRNILT